MTIRTQTKSPTTVVSDDSVGTLPWVDPEKAKVEDNDPATATNSGGETAETEYLKCTGFPFTIPTTATILGRKRTIRRRTSAGTVTHVATSAVASGNADSGFPINKPSGVVAGDVMVAYIIGNEFNGGTPTISRDGWALGPTTNYAIDNDRYRVTLLTRTADETDEDEGTTSYEFTIAGTGARDGLGVISAYRGGVVGTSSSFNPSLDAPSVTTQRDNARVIAVFSGHHFSAITWTPPSGATERCEGSFESYRMTLTDYVQSTAGATGTKTATPSSATGTNRSAQLVIEPAFPVDSVVSLVLADGSLGGQNKASAAEWPADYASASYGGASDLWGEVDLTPETENDEDSGGILSVLVPPGGTVYVDGVTDEVTYDVSLEVAIDTPGEDGTVTQPGFTAEATFELDGSPVTLASSRWYIATDAAGENVVYDSGALAGSATSHVIGSGTPALQWQNPQNDATYYLRVTGTENGSADPDGVGDAISGASGWVPFTTDWTPLPAITGLTATAVTEEV